jgi:hypothetical protein
VNLRTAKAAPLWISRGITFASALLAAAALDGDSAAGPVAVVSSPGRRVDHFFRCVPQLHLAQPSPGPNSCLPACLPVGELASPLKSPPLLSSSPLPPTPYMPWLTDLQRSWRTGSWLPPTLFWCPPALSRVAWWPRRRRGTARYPSFALWAA